MTFNTKGNKIKPDYDEIYGYQIPSKRYIKYI